MYITYTVMSQGFNNAWIYHGGHGSDRPERWGCPERCSSSETYFAINAGAKLVDITFSDADFVGTNNSWVWPLGIGFRVTPYSRRLRLPRVENN